MQSMSGFGPDPDYELAWRAVERGLLTKEQVESAVLECQKTPSSRLIDLLPLTPEQVRALSQGTSSAAPRPLPPEVEEAAKLPEMMVGKYVVTGQLGAGGMGVVVKAYDTQRHRWAALKFMKGIADERGREYFEREARVAAGLTHPNIASIYEVGDREGQPYIAMQYVEGENLTGARKKMGLTEVVGAVRKVGEALRYAHEKGIIHRDLKPANVMVDGRGGVYVMDFGLAKERTVEGGQSLGGSSLVVGTPQYMAPEQAKGKADAQSDVYGVGTILYEMTTGRPPFVGETTPDVLMQVVNEEPVWPRRLNRRLPEDLEAIILRALEKEKKRRYGTMRELLEDLEAYGQGNPLKHARRPTLLYILGKKIRKQPLLWGTTAALVAALIGGIGFGSHTLVQRNAALGKQVQAEKEKREAAVTHLLIFRSNAALATNPSEALRLALAAWRTQPQNIDAHHAVLTAYYGPDAFPITLAEAKNTEYETSDSWFSASFSPDSKTILSVDRKEPGQLRLFDISGVEKVLTLKAPSITAELSRDGAHILTSTADHREAVLWDSAGTELRRFPHEQLDFAVFSPTGDRVITGGGNTIALLWSVDGTLIARLKGHTYGAWAAAFSPDGNTIATAGGADNTAHLWSGKGEPLAIVLSHPDHVTGVAFSPDGNMLATTCWDGLPRLWWLENGRLVKSYKGHTSRTFSPSFSPDGKYLATAGWDDTVRIWWGTPNLVDTALKRLPSVTSVNTATWSPDGRWLATTGGKTLTLWDVATPRYEKIQLQFGLTGPKSFGEFTLEGGYRSVNVLRLGAPFFSLPIAFTDRIYQGAFVEGGRFIDTTGGCRFPFRPEAIQDRVTGAKVFGALFAPDFP
jgi:serine/threonine protein kinase